MFEGLTFERLKSFLEVADAGGFSLAAPGNPVRQSQLSRQVRELENAFGGCALFKRRGRGVSLTEEGERLRAVVREMQAGIEDISGTASNAPIRFRLGAGDSLLQWLVIPRIAELSSRVRKGAQNTKLSGVSLIPELISLSSAAIVAQLKGAQLDFGLVREVPGDLCGKPLGQIDYALYVPKALLLHGRNASKVSTSKVIGDLVASLPLALQSSEPELNKKLLSLVGQRPPTMPVLQCETFPQASCALRSGKYAALLPTIADENLPSKDIAEFGHSEFTGLSKKLYLAWHPRTKRRGDIFRELILALTELLRLPPVSE